MSAKPRATSPNQLLAALPRKERDAFLADCTLEKLVFGTVLYEQGERMRHVYFPTEGFISMLITVDGHSTLEVGMIGREGMCGHALNLGGDVSSLRALVQGAGAAWRMKTATFQRHLERMTALRKVLGRYVHVVLGQLSHAAACLRFHVVEKRLARWLLMTQDRAHTDSFSVTQEFLAFMLGVRRSGVTTAAGILQSRKLISYTRGKMTILNRRRLEAAACACYRSDLDAYRLGMAGPAKS
ncbi:MAG TPA: Crp/Fnr family transcriptional regulator [Rudaea sp.]|nr:Crp/Fnr family transcriptional regulator [Rudaea sp.]